MKDNKPILKVQMLGGFVMNYGGKNIRVGKSQRTKALQLLQILLYAGEKGIANDKLIDYLYGNTTGGDSANNLRVTVYNLRKLLKDSELPDENYVRAEGGHHRFTASFPVEVDVHVFEKKMQQAWKKMGDQRLKLMKSLCESYGGTFLPALHDESWAVETGSHYRNLFYECMKDVSTMMKERQEYEELLPLVNKAAEIYPFDEWQVWQMECLQALNREKDAQELYEKTSDLYFDKLGVPPSEQLLESFRQMRGNVPSDQDDFQEIQEKLKEKNQKEGAYYCAFPSFFDSIQILCRNSDRTGNPISLVLCTLTDQNDQLPAQSEEMKQISGKMLESIGKVLRRGDIYTHYSANQFLILLPGMEKKDCRKVTDRIDAEFQKNESAESVKTVFRITDAHNAIETLHSVT